MAERVVLLVIPQLRQRDVTPGGLASLEELEGRGSICELVPAFPGLAAASFATLITGAAPSQHGLIGNTYFDRAACRVVPPPLRDSALEAPRVWQNLKAANPSSRALLWFAPNSLGADVEFNAWIDESGSLATEPAGLAGDLVARCGPLPAAFALKGREPRLEFTSWMLNGAGAVIASEKPDLAIVRIPYLGQVARRFGPDGREAGRAIRELEPLLAKFLQALPRGTCVLAVTESVATPVRAPIYPNQVLRNLGLLHVSKLASGGIDADLTGSDAFAVADHQICHVYLNDPTQAATVSAAFSGDSGDGVALVAPGSRRARLGMNHPRAGDVILVSEPDRWFSAEWWRGAPEAPTDRHAGSGLASLRLDIPVDSSLVRGSLGAPSPGSQFFGIMIASDRRIIGDRAEIAATEIAGVVQQALAGAAIYA